MAGKLFHWESDWHYSFDYWGSPLWERLHEKEMRGFHNSSVTPDAVHPEIGFFRDSEIVTSSIKFLNNLNNRQEPWFLGVGLKGTHMQYQMPYRFWKQYENFSANINNITHEHLKFPTSTPLMHHVKKTEGTNILYMNNEGKEKGYIEENYQTTGLGRTISVKGYEELYRGYLACLSYADFQLGRLLDELDRLDIWKDTIVIFTSDHGMHLGEKGIWGKWTLFDETSRVPLIIHDPKSPESFGKHYSHPVELIDIFPTLIDLTGVSLENPCPFLPLIDKRGHKEPIPGEAQVVGSWKHIFRHAHCFSLDGSSLAPAFTKGDAFKKTRDFSITQRLTCKFRSKDNDPTTPDWMDFCPFKKVPRDPPFGALGYSARWKRWRYIGWLEFDVHSFLPSLHLPPLAEELYDHRMDNIETSSLGRDEIVNLATNNEFNHILLELRVKLYDFLWYNNSYEHLFQKFQKAPEMSHIVAGRVPSDPRPHTLLYPGHFYSHHSYHSQKRNVDQAEKSGSFLPSIFSGKNFPRTDFFPTLSGLINITQKQSEELESVNNNGLRFTKRKSNRKKSQQFKI